MKLRQITMAQMTKALFAAFALLLLTTACGDNDPSTPDPTSSAPTTTPTSIASGEPAPGKVDIAPGRIGAAKVGMTKTEAAATGYFDTDVEVGGDVCNRIEPLQWKDLYKGQVDVLTDDAGSIVSMGVWKTLKTDKGIGIGNTLGEVNDAYGDNVSPAQEAGYGQSGVYVTDGDKWLGFLVNETWNDVTPSSKVTFIEVTKGSKPDLIRDGC